MSTAEARAYEQSRAKNLEANQMRMQQLNLINIKNQLTATKPLSVKKKQSKPRVARMPVDLVPARRSHRVADKPQPNYREPLFEPMGRLARRGYSERSYLLDSVHASKEDKLYALQRAKELKSKLESVFPQFPCFTKSMLHSHVVQGFWLGLPSHFCKSYLPKEDEFITLEDEEGGKTDCNYLADRTGLSGGWRGFALDHELKVGDCVIFQLVTDTKFKVFFIRVKERPYRDEANRDDEIIPDNGLEDPEGEVYEIAIR